MKNDTMKLLESIQNNLNKKPLKEKGAYSMAHNITTEQFESMLTSTINKVYKFTYYPENAVQLYGFAANIFDNKGFPSDDGNFRKLGSIGYEKNSDNYVVYVDIIRDDKVVDRKEKRYVSIEEAIDFLDECANEQLNILNN